VEDEDSTLWALERKFWLGGAEVYRRHLADEALMVFPGMVLAKSQTLESIAAGPRWTSVSFSDQRLVRLTSEVAVLSYRASGVREHEPSAYSALVNSVYVRRDREWQLALHQQSSAHSPR
jgi:hypothetical protein